MSPLDLLVGLVGQEVGENRPQAIVWDWERWQRMDWAGVESIGHMKGRLSNLGLHTGGRTVTTVHVDEHEHVLCTYTLVFTLFSLT